MGLRMPGLRWVSRYSDYDTLYDTCPILISLLVATTTATTSTCMVLISKYDNYAFYDACSEAPAVLGETTTTTTTTPEDDLDYSSNSGQATRRPCWEPLIGSTRRCIDLTQTTTI